MEDAVWDWTEATVHSHGLVGESSQDRASIEGKTGQELLMCHRGDFVDEQGNVFEVLHWEWDGFNHDEVNDKKKQIEPFLLSVDWNDAARKILARKDEWHHLGFFEQSAWKTRFFGIEKERFKMVLWQ